MILISICNFVRLFNKNVSFLCNTLDFPTILDRQFANSNIKLGMITAQLCTHLCIYIFYRRIQGITSHLVSELYHTVKNPS